MRRLIARSATTAALTSKMAPSTSMAASVAVRRIHATVRQLKPAMAAMASTTTSFPQTHEKIQTVENTPYFVDNKFVQSNTDKYIDLPDPATNNLVTRVPQNTEEEMKAAVESSKKAFESWKNTTVLHRQQIMFRFVNLVRENWDRLAASITLEQ